MDATRGGNVPVTFPETNNTTVTTPANEEEIWTIWVGVVSCPNTFITFDFSRRHKFNVPGSVPIHQLFGGFMKTPPYLHEWAEHIGTNGIGRLESREHCPASKERLSVGADILGEVGGDLMGKALLVSYPFEELSPEWRHVLKLHAVKEIKGILFNLHTVRISYFGIIAKHILYSGA